MMTCRRRRRVSPRVSSLSVAAAWPANVHAHVAEAHVHIDAGRLEAADVCLSTAMELCGGAEISSEVSLRSVWGGQQHRPVSAVHATLNATRLVGATVYLLAESCRSPTAVRLPPTARLPRSSRRLATTRLPQRCTRLRQQRPLARRRQQVLAGLQLLPAPAALPHRLQRAEAERVAVHS